MASTTLQGLVIGVQQGNTSQPVADKLVAEHRAARVRVYAYDEIEKALDDLSTGGCDAFMKLAPVTAWFVRDRPKLKVVQTGITTERLGICVRKGNAALREAIGKAQAELMADGTLAALVKEWLGDGARLPGLTTHKLKILPGFMMFCGSSARLIARIDVERRRAMLGLEVFHLALADAVLAGAGAVHGERALDQPLDEGLGARDLVGVVHVDQQRRRGNCRRRHGRRSARSGRSPSMSRLVSVDAFGKPRDRHADVGRERACAPGRSAARRPIGVVARLPEPRAVLGAWSPSRTARRRIRAAISPKRSTCSATPASVPWNSRNSIGVSGKRELGIGVAGPHLQLVEQLDARHRNAGSGWSRWPRCRPPRPTGNGQTPAEIASGMPCSFSVSSVMTPSVPSEPTSSRVRS